MNLPFWIGANQVLGPPLGANSRRAFYVDLLDHCFRLVVEKGNQAVGVNKLPDYSRSFSDKQYEQMYINWIAFINQTVPSDKLLEFNVKQGMEPLADFCDRPEPEWTMPFVNDSEQFNFYVTLLKVFCEFNSNITERI